MSLYVPRLSRATSDYLQLRAKEAAAALEVIEESLYDFRTVNSVYQLLISQASKEPLRFRPSSETLFSISQFCVCALNTFGSGAAHERTDLERSLHFLQSLVDQVISDSPSISASSHTSDEHNSSLRQSSSLHRARSLESNTPNGTHDSENGDVVSTSAPQPSTSRMVNSFGGGSSLSSEILPTSVRRTRTPVFDPATPAKRVDSVQKGMWSSSMWSGVVPTSTGDFHMHRRSRSDTLADKFVQEMLNFKPPQIWMNHGTASTLQIVRAVLSVGINRNNSDMEGESWLSVTNMKGLMCLEHLWTVVDHQNGLNTTETRRSGNYSLGSGPLFQYKSYKEQESLNLDSKEIAIIVDTVCGSQDYHDSAIWDENHISDLWESSSTSKPIGEGCVTILVKLIMDMYLKNGPGLSYILVLQMLQRSLSSALTAVKIRAFDLVYNLALHSTMMSNTPDGSFFEKNKQTIERKRDNSNRNSRDLDRLAIPKLHTLQEETEPPIEQDDDVLEMIPWVRSLLFDLMVIITESDEQDIQVWTSAIGCFLHLTTSDGEFLWNTIQNFPFSVIQRILRISVKAGWSDELHVHFVRLFVNLSYISYEKGDRRVNEVRILQGGGIEEILLHLRHTRSVEAASWLLQLLIDFISQTTNCSEESLSPLLSNLMSPSVVDITVSRCQHGGNGIENILHSVLQNCIIEKNAMQDSPKNPVHHRHKTQSSFLSSDTTGSIAPGIDPECLEVWNLVLNRLDSFLCPSFDDHKVVERVGDPLLGKAGDMEVVSWDHLLGDYLGSPQSQDRILGIRWIRKYCMAQLESHLKQEDKANMSLLPAYTQTENELSKVLKNWLIMSGSNPETGVELARLMDEMVSNLISLHYPDAEPDVSNANNSWAFVRKLGTVLFHSLQSGLSWIRSLPLNSKRYPLLSMSYHVCQLVHAPYFYGDVASTAHSDGIATVPGPFVYNDFILGTSAVYIHLLRLAPIDFLWDLICSLEEFCSVYKKEGYVDQMGFYGRPGHKSSNNKTAQNNIPWTDTVSDIRSALTLLLLHRCSMDSKGKDRLEGICRSLLEDEDVRVQYLASRYLLKYAMEEKSSVCREALREFVAKAQQMNNERLVDNPYLQVKHILESEQKEKK